MTAAEAALVVERLAADSIPEPNTGCLLWMRGGNTRGYAMLHHAPRRGQREYVHRLAWMVRHGEISPLMYVCHRCDVPACLNVDHLFLGSARDNARDASAKGRLSHSRGAGVTNPNVILVENAVHRMRRLWATGLVTQPELARLFGVSQVTVSDIVCGRRWACAPGEIVTAHRRSDEYRETRRLAAQIKKQLRASAAEMERRRGTRE